MGRWVCSEGPLCTRLAALLLGAGACLYAPSLVPGICHLLLPLLWCCRIGYQLHCLVGLEPSPWLDLSRGHTPCLHRLDGILFHCPSAGSIEATRNEVTNHFVSNNFPSGEWCRVGEVCHTCCIRGPTCSHIPAVLQRDQVMAGRR